MSEYKLKESKIEKAVVGAYKKIEKAFVDAFLHEDGSMKTGGMAEKATATYQKMEDAAVGAYKKVENAFVDAIREGQDIYFITHFFQVIPLLLTLTIISRIYSNSKRI